MVVLLIWDSFPTVYNTWGHHVLLWELQQRFSPMVLPLVSLEMLKHLCFLPPGVLSANFSRWHLTSSSVPPVGWTPWSPTSYGLNVSLCFSPSLAWASQSPEWAPHEAQGVCSSTSSAWTAAPSPDRQEALPCHSFCWDTVQEWHSTVCTYLVQNSTNVYYIFHSALGAEKLNTYTTSLATVCLNLHI